MSLLLQHLVQHHSLQGLNGQFILTRNASSVPRDWEQRARADWILSTHPSLLVTPHSHPSGDMDLWIVGHVVDPNRKQFGFPFDLFDSPNAPTFKLLEQSLHHVFGRFVVIAFSGREARCYLDAAGHLAAVYCPSQQLVASTPSLIPYTADTPDDVPLVNAMDVCRTNNFYCFGMTPRKGVERLLPNHYLDLSTFHPVRHWPPHSFSHRHERGGVDTDQTIAEIAAILRASIETVCNETIPLLSLTAGRDSRMLLACSRGVTDRIRFVTWDLPDEMGEVDIRVATKLAGVCNLQHEVFPFKEASPEEQQAWHFRTGLTAGELRGIKLVSTIRKLHGQVHLPGLAAEVGRADYWQAGDEDRDALSVSDLVHRLRLPLPAAHFERADAWLSNLPVTARPDVLDFLHLEQLLGCWAGPIAYGDAVGPLQWLPFANRRLIELMLLLPYEFRREQRLADALLKQCWPELLDVLFNPHGSRHFLRRKLRNVPLLWRVADRLR